MWDFSAAVSLLPLILTLPGPFVKIHLTNFARLGLGSFLDITFAMNNLTMAWHWMLTFDGSWDVMLAVIPSRP